MLVDTFSIASDIYPSTFDHGLETDPDTHAFQRKGRPAKIDDPRPCDRCYMHLYCKATGASCKAFSVWTGTGRHSGRFSQVPLL